MTRTGAEAYYSVPLAFKRQSGRVVVALAIGVYAVCWFLWDHSRAPGNGSDIDHVWFGATALRLGLNPYTAIGPGAAWRPAEWPLFYPMTGIIVALPLSFIPIQIVRCLFIFSSSALLAYAVTRESWTPLILFASGAFVEAARLAQWSILFAASLLLPALLALVPAKPTIGLISAAGARRPSRRALWWIAAAWAFLVIASFVAFPGWLSSWLVNVRAAPQYRPLIRSPLGVLLLLAGLRWRRAEARMLLAYAVVPHLPLAYEAVPAMLIARTRPEYLTLAAGSCVAYAVQSIVLWPQDHLMLDWRVATASLVFIYLPALGMVLRRPNVRSAGIGATG